MKAQPEATPRETVAALLQRSGRDALPVRTTFVQTKSPDGVSLPGPLATFVRNGDELGLDLYLLVHSAASAAPWDVRLHAAVWTRGLCHTGRRISETGLSKVWARLESRQLVSRSRDGRLNRVTLLDEGGSGAEYTRPGGQAGQRYFKLPYSYWLGEPAPCGLLELPAKAMLLVALSLKSPFYLPLGSVPEWYGFSRDTAQRGFGELIERGLVSFHDKVVAAPLAPSGSTRRRYYSVSAALAEAIPPVG